MYVSLGTYIPLFSRYVCFSRNMHTSIFEVCMFLGIHTYIHTYIHTSHGGGAEVLLTYDKHTNLPCMLPPWGSYSPKLISRCVFGHTLTFGTRFFPNLTTFCRDRASPDVIFLIKTTDLMTLCSDYVVSDPFRPYIGPYMFVLCLSNLITFCGDCASRDVMFCDPSSNLMALCGDHVTSNP